MVGRGTFQARPQPRRKKTSKRVLGKCLQFYGTMNDGEQL